MGVLTRLRVSPQWWLAVVAAAFLVAQMVLVGGVALGWDESIYASQTDPRRPALAFTAPRARGTAWLAAPVLAATDSLWVLRAWFALLSSAALYVAYAVWLRSLRGPTVPLAAALFASLWTTVFYGPSLMPNVLVALAGLFATGAMLRTAQGIGYPVLPWFGGAAVAVATLVRPGDVAPLLLSLAAAVVLWPPWRRRAIGLLVPLVLGAVVGALPWIVEAELRYDNTFLRVRRALSTQSTGERFVPDYQLRSLDGPLLCRPCNRDTQPIPPLGVVLWVVGTVLIALAVVLAVRRAFRSTREATLLPAAVGVAGALPYLFLVGYAAPRFLLPAYALVALPVAQALGWLAAPRGRPHPLGVGVVGALVLGHVFIQLVWLNRVIEGTEPGRARYVAIARALDAHGVRPPCTLVGTESAPVAYVARCDQVWLGSPGDERFTPAELERRIATQSFAVVLRPGDQVPEYARGWRQIPRSELPRGWRILLASSPRTP